MMTNSLQEKLQTIQTLFRGHTDRNEEVQILDILETAGSRELNLLLEDLDLGQLISDIDDRWFGPDNRSRLFRLLTATRLADLEVGSRVRLVNALQEGRTGPRRERAIQDVFLGTMRSDLKDLKNGIDRGGDYHDLQQLIFTDIDDRAIRDRILTHIQQEAPPLTDESDLKAIRDISPGY